MPNTGPVYVEADVATWSSGIAAGTGLHLPVGDYGGADYRSAMRFPLPAGWNSWTSIQKATLTFYISDFQHVGPNSSSIFCSRQNTSAIWTKAEGSQSCESGFTAGNTSQYGDLVNTSTDRVTFTSGSTANKAITLDVTAAIRYYWNNGLSTYHPVFVFDNNGAGEYTEIWSRNKSGYYAYLSIDYTDAAPPLAPTQGAPAAGATGLTVRPTFSWTHNDPDAQNAATVRIWDAAGTTLVATWPQAGAAQSMVAQADLVNGTTYQWDVATSDAVSGYGPYSGKRSFAIKALPVVTISAVRKMVFANGQPRLLVAWTCDQPQSAYQVTGGGYDSTKKSGTDQNHTLVTLALVSGTAVTVTVQVWNTDGTALVGTASRSFTPRYGLTSHKKTLGAVPVNMQAAAVTATVPLDAVNGDCALVIEYGMAASAGASVPTSWVSSPTNLPKPYTQYLHWRAWFIPNNVTGPTLDRIDIPYDVTVAVLDNWGSPVWPWENPGALPARWVIDTGESVYGTRSLRCDPDGSPYHIIYSNWVKVREGRSYVLSGLMRSQGNSGALLRIQDIAGGELVRSTKLSTPSVLTDWERYKAPVWVAPADMTICVAAISEGGVAGSTGWWDGVKLEESLIATPWNPATVGATTVDAGGVQIDATKGGLLRLKGSAGGARDIVQLGSNGLVLGGDVDVFSSSPGRIDTDATTLALGVGSASATTQVQAGQIEIFGSANAFIDFKNTAASDYDARILLGSVSSGQLAIYPPAAGLRVNGLLQQSAGYLYRSGGTSFPGGAASGDRYWRTDLRMEFFFDGARWLSTTLFTAPLVASGVIPPRAASSTDYGVLDYHGGSDIWLETVQTAFYVNAGGTALAVGQSWGINVNKVDAVAATSFATVTVNSGASGQWRRDTQVVNALAGAGWSAFRGDVAKTGTPGTLYSHTAVNYRVVAT